MVSNGEVRPRGSLAAASAGLRRRKSGPAAGKAASTMLQFYTDDAASRKISPNTVLAMSVGFVAVIALLHALGKIYLAQG